MNNDYRTAQDMEGVDCGQFCNIIAETQENDGEPELACRTPGGDTGTFQIQVIHHDLLHTGVSTLWLLLLY
jgi:hypothetical protein